MFYIWLSIALVYSCGQSDASFLATKDESCKHLYNTFTENTNEFIGCILVHNKNATFCTDCRPQFTNLFNAYKTLTQSKTCRTEFVEVNRLNLVDISWVNAQNIWDVAICSDCYDTTNCDPVSFEGCVQSNRTIEFMDLYTNATACINGKGFKPNETCAKCSEDYDKLNKFYTKIRFDTADKLCFDIKDRMNKTQIHWSKELKCCEERKVPELEFYMSSSANVFFALLFYAVMFIHGLKKETIHFISDDLMPGGSRARASNYSVAIDDQSDDQLLPSTSHQIHSFKLPHPDTDDDDDELLPLPYSISNPNLAKI